MLEIKTLFISSMVMNYVLALVVFWAWRQNRDRFQGIGEWALSMLFSAVVLTLVSFRGIIPDFFSIVLGQLMLPIGAYLMILGYGRFFGIKPARWIHVVLGILAVAWSFYFTYLDENLRMRVVGLSAVAGIQYFIAVYVLQYQVKPAYRETTRLTAIILVMMAFCQLWRVKLAFNHEIHLPKMAAHPLDSFPFLLLTVFAVMLAISWLIMVNQRQRNELLAIHEEVARSEKRYKALADHSPIGIAIFDKSEKILFANAQFTRILKLEPEDVIGKDFKQYIARESLERAVNVFRDRQSGSMEVPSFHEVALMGPNGRLKWIEVHGAILEKSDTDCQTLIQAIDITARKKSETALSDYQRNLEEMLGGRSGYASAIYTPKIE